MLHVSKCRFDWTRPGDEGGGASLDFLKKGRTEGRKKKINPITQAAYCSAGSCAHADECKMLSFANADSDSRVAQDPEELELEK